MVKFYIFIGFLAFLFSCQNENKVISEGIWRAELEVMDGQRLPFTFNLMQEGKDYKAEIYNGEEVIKLTNVLIDKDSIVFYLPVFEAYLKGTFTADKIEGVFFNKTFNRTLPFIATYGKLDRFPSETKPTSVVSGIWATSFIPDTPDQYDAKGIFVQNNHIVTGTFRTTTGDYRFLEGIVMGDSLKLSAFDGAHAYLFLSKIKDSVMEGIFYSGSHDKEFFLSHRDDAFELPDEEALTFLKEGFETFDFSFPDKSGKSMSLSDEQFQGKPIIVQIMGSWCTNSLDETRFLVDFLDQHKETDISVVALAFEFAKTEEQAFQGIQKLKNNAGVPYPILLAQYGGPNKQKAQEKLPMLNHVYSYPTLVFIDKKRKVRRIITGFNGPGTGDKYLTFKNEFKEFVTMLANE